MEKTELKQMDKKYLVTVAALNALEADDIEKAIRDCIFTKLFEEPNGLPLLTLGAEGLEETMFPASECRGRNGQDFVVGTRTDGTQQVVILPDEVESRDNAFGPSPFSPQFEEYRRSYTFGDRGPADFNMVVVPVQVMATVGWHGVREVVLRFARGDFGEHPNPATALTEGGRYRIHNRLVRIAREGEGLDDVLIVDLLDQDGPTNS